MGTFELDAKSVTTREEDAGYVRGLCEHYEVGTHLRQISVDSMVRIGSRMGFKAGKECTHVKG